MLNQMLFMKSPQRDTELPVAVIFLLLAVCFFPHSVRAELKIEQIYIPINTYTTKEGLISNNVQDIVQDDSGFIWMATEKGLSRFDSEEFINFSKDKSQPDSIPDTAVEELELMPDGNIWMSVYNVGITQFNPASGQFKSVKNSDSDLFHMPARTANNLFGMARDKNNHFWMSIYGEGIYQWIPEKNQFIKHLQSNENSWLTSKKTFEIMVDSQNRLWICTIDSKVIIYDIDTKQSKEFNFASNPNDPLSSPIYGFAEDNKGQIYAGGFSGMYKYNESSEDFEHIITKQDIIDIYGERSSVRRVMIDSNNNIWIGTLQSLLHYKDGALSEVLFYEYGSLLQPLWHIHSIIESYDGSLWLGTEGHGLLRIPSDWNRFNLYFSENPEPEDMRRALLYKDKIWVGHPSSKIDLLTMQDDQIKFVKTMQPYLDGENIRIDSLFQDNDDSLWISSIQGIHKLNLNTGVTTRVSHHDGQKLGSVRLIHKSGDRYFFNLFSENSIAYFTEKEMIAHMIPNTVENSFQGNMVSQFSKGPDGVIWMSNNRGLQSLNPETLIFRHIYSPPNEEMISSFLFSENNSLWMILDGGLKEFEWDGNDITPKPDRYKNILPKVNFKSIAKVENNELLITSDDGGLIQLNTETLEHEVFNMERGLPSNELVDVLFLQDTAILVTEQGIASFRNDFFPPPMVQPKLVIDSLTLADQPLDSDSEALTLEHNYGSLNFKLALLTFTDFKTQEFEYKLQGSNHDWVNTGSDRRFSFLNLRPGDYTFMVRGRKEFGIWSNEVHFPFTVKSPYWQSPLAYMIYVLFSFLLVLWLMYIYRRKVRYELEIDKQSAQKRLAHAESKAKSDFLARVSHEVRTPLNGVMGMSELMLDTPLNDEQKIYAEAVIDSSQHLLGVINDILDLSKIEAGKIDLEQGEFDLSKLLDEVLLSCTSLSNQKKILFTCHMDPQVQTQRLGDTVRIKQILFNLLNNAFKFTDKGSIQLIIHNAENNHLSFQVKDTGVGIQTKMKNKLFEPFVQEDSSITRKYGGSGLGLAIVKQLVEKMNGRIEVESEAFKGTCFRFSLQLEACQHPSEHTRGNQSIQVKIKNQQLRESVLSMLEVLKIPQNIESASGLTLTDQAPDSSHEQCLFVISADQKWHKISLPVTFRVLRDITSPLGRQPSPNPLLQNVSLTPSLNVLLVEDNVINQQVSIELIEKFGHTIDVVDHVDEALVLLNRNNYHLLLLDYHLPEKNGLSLIDSWENKRRIPVIVVTADLTLDVHKECEYRKIRHILAKPFTASELKAMIDLAINNE